MTEASELMTMPATDTADLELVSPSDPRAAFLSINPQRLGGMPVFRGTRVPVSYLFEYLAKGKTLESFLDDFDGVPREEAVAALRMGFEKMMEGLPAL
ncbi:MAG: DUF433 domain-containing protein [Blastocatellia bacterium]